MSQNRDGKIRGVGILPMSSDDAQGAHAALTSANAIKLLHQRGRDGSLG
jgi:hypothetical protein